MHDFVVRSTTPFQSNKPCCYGEDLQALRPAVQDFERAVNWPRHSPRRCSLLEKVCKDDAKGLALARQTTTLGVGDPRWRQCASHQPLSFVQPMAVHGPFRTAKPGCGGPRMGTPRLLDRAKRCGPWVSPSLETTEFAMASPVRDRPSGGAASVAPHGSGRKMAPMTPRHALLGQPAPCSLVDVRTHPARNARPPCA